MIAGRKWLDEKFLPYFGPVALLALIYTVLVLFGLQVRGHMCTNAAQACVHVVYLLARHVSLLAAAPWLRHCMSACVCVNT